jgi:hypothetical protein
VTIGNDQRRSVERGGWQGRRVSQVLDSYASVARLSVSSCRSQLGNDFEPLKIRLITADSNDVKQRNSLSGADYAASLNAPTSSNQGCRRFHLGQIWATISKSLISND